MTPPDDSCWTDPAWAEEDSALIEEAKRAMSRAGSRKPKTERGEKQQIPFRLAPYDVRMTDNVSDSDSDSDPIGDSTMSATAEAPAVTLPSDPAVQTNVVEGGAPKKRGPKAKPKIDLATYTDSAPQAELDAEGRLTCLPSAWDIDKHEPLKKGDFATEDLFLGWKAAYYDQRAKFFTARAAKIRSDMEALKKFGSPETRKKVRRAQKLAEQLAALNEALKNEGVILPD